MDHGYPIADHNVRLVKGKVQETTTVTGPVCLAHIDVDWYEPVYHCLEQITPFADDKRRYCAARLTMTGPGCRTATDEYFRSVGRDSFSFDDSAGHLVVTRPFLTGVSDALEVQPS